MRFSTGEAYRRWPNKVIVLFGMSGIGKTTLADVLRAAQWYHYSVDYRIGTRYMGEYIANSYKRAAMAVPLFEDLLRSDSIDIKPNIGFRHLRPLSMYLGRPGDERRGGLAFAEYRRRQRQHRRAEINALLDMPDFIEMARDIYGYNHFVCDTGGSFCEVIDPDAPDDQVLDTLSGAGLLLYLQEPATHAATLVARFQQDPKPMYYREDVLSAAWQSYKNDRDLGQDDEVDPDDFAIYGFSRLLAHRQPIYRRIARTHGYVIGADRLAGITTAEEFHDAVAEAIDTKAE